MPILFGRVELSFSRVNYICKVRDCVRILEPWVPNSNAVDIICPSGLNRVN